MSDVLLEEEDSDAAAVGVARAISSLGEIDPKKLDALSRFHPSDSYLAYSRAAVEKLLPHLEAGLDEFDAIRKAYPDRPQAEMLDRLPIPPGSITNPVVRRALVEVRKVVNAILREYGRPDRIVVEMAREMAHGGKTRSEMSSRMRKREKVRDEVRRILSEDYSVERPGRDLILRYELWEEQDGRCPYTGRGIEVASVVSAGADLQVDHILPRWRSLDDSRGNKVLTFGDVNREKGDRTPWEWRGESSEFDEMIDHVERLRKMPQGKKRRFVLRDLAVDDFVQRQLNDTRYISREIVQFLNGLYPPELRVGEKAVRGSPGRLTAELRRCWGLNNVFTHWDGPEHTGPKIRDDHRHHAVDALVVALSTRSHLQRYSRFRKAHEEGVIDPDSSPTDFGPPWPTFRADAQEAIESIVVSHRVQRKISGAFHEETFFGATDDETTFVFRKKLDDAFKESDLKRVRDDRVRELLSTHLQAQGWVPGAALPKGAFVGDNAVRIPPRDPGSGPGTPIRRVRLTRTMKSPVGFEDHSGRLFRFAQLGNNHHMEVADVGHDGETAQLRARVVPMREVAGRVRRRGLDAVERDLDDGMRFAMSLARKESVLVVDPETGEDRLCVVQKLTGSQDWASGFDLYLRDARDARAASEGNRDPFRRLRSFGAWAALNPRKVAVDPLGRVFPAGD